MEPGLYRHIKTGNIYRLLSDATDCTNSRDGIKVAVYCRDGENYPLFVREMTEFSQKFQPFS